jgi:hypothetical protein
MARNIKKREGSGPEHQLESASRWPDGDPWEVRIGGHSDCHCDSAGESERPTVNPSRERARAKDDCCSQLIEALRCIPGVDERCLRLSKPKIPSKVKLANLCGALPFKEAIGPIMMLLLRRYRSGVEALSAFEKSQYQFLSGLKSNRPAKYDMLLRALDEYDAIPLSLKECIFENRFDDWPDDRPVDVGFVAKHIVQEFLAFGQHTRDGTFDPPTPGLSRPWEQTFDAPVSEPGKRIKKTAPWPWICAISPVGARLDEAADWYRNESIRTPGDQPEGWVKYKNHEYSFECDPPSGPVAANATLQGNCRRQKPIGGSFGGVCEGGIDYLVQDPTSPQQACLRIPKVNPGAEVGLKGFNFTSTNCTVWLTRSDGGPPPFNRPIELPITSLIGDKKSPSSLANCGVEDLVYFRIPKEIKHPITSPNYVPLPPGLYTIQLQFPGLVQLSPLGTPKIEPMLSNLVLIDLQPDPELKYTVRADEAFCLEETGGIGSDEAYFVALRAEVEIPKFITPTEESLDVAFQLQFSDPFTVFDKDDVDSGEVITFPGVNLYDGKPADKVIAIGILGLEIDDRSAANEKVKDFFEAFELYWKNLFVDAGASVSGGMLGTGLGVSTLTNISWMVWAGGGGLAALLVGGIFYSFWAPADTLAFDLILLDSGLLYERTTRDPSPPEYGYQILDVSVRIQPLNKREAGDGTSTLYPEYHNYFSVEEGSRYRLRISTRRS